MAKTTRKLILKFSEYIPNLILTATGELDLRDGHYKLYKRLYRYYTKEGVTFTGDAAVDYNIIVNCINEDLYSPYYNGL